MRKFAANDPVVNTNKTDFALDEEALRSESVFKSIYGFYGSIDQRKKAIELRRRLDLTIRDFRILFDARAVCIQHNSAAIVCMSKLTVMKNMLFLGINFFFIFVLSFLPAMVDKISHSQLAGILVLESIPVVFYYEFFKRTFVARGILKDRGIKIAERWVLLPEKQSEKAQADAVYRAFGA